MFQVVAVFAELHMTKISKIPMFLSFFPNGV
nr:MAG TPA: hypothetical protein [Caudoviricetes sp.]